MERQPRKSSLAIVASVLALTGALLSLIGPTLLLFGPLAPGLSDPCTLAVRVLAQGTATVSIVPQTVEMTEDDTTTVDIRVEDVSDLDSVDILVTFDPDILEVVDADDNTGDVEIEPGSFLGDDATVDTNIVYQEDGEIYFEQTSGAQPGDGDGVLARITFSGKGIGTSDVNFDEAYLTLEDTDSDPIDFEVQEGSITVVGEGTPTSTLSPTPTAEQTSTPTHTPVPGATATPEPTSTPSATPPSSPLETPTPGPSPTASATPAPSATPTPGPSPSPGASPTPRPSPSPTTPPGPDRDLRVLQVWPDRSVGVISGQLKGSTASTSTLVLPFGVASTADGDIVRARTYLHFPIEALPLGTDVLRATLYVYVDSSSSTESGKFGVYRALETWEENDPGGNPNTWPVLLRSPIALTTSHFGVATPTSPAPANDGSPTPTQKAETSPTSTPPASPLDTPTSTPPTLPLDTPTSTPSPTPSPSPGPSPTPGVPSVALAPATSKRITWDVTALVRAWLAGDVPNQGMALASAPVPNADLEAAGDLIVARRLSIDDLRTRPYLVVEFKVLPVTLTPTATRIPYLPPAGSNVGWKAPGLVLVGIAGTMGLALLASGLSFAARRR